jgi:hypothetical protein
MLVAMSPHRYSDFCLIDAQFTVIAGLDRAIRRTPTGRDCPVKPSNDID